MRIFSIVFSVIAYALPCFGQSVVRGMVFSALDSSCIPFATVLNQSHKEGVAATSNGEFSLRAFPADTIQFSAVGFEIYRFNYSGSEGLVSIYMCPSVQQIETVVIRAFPKRELLKPQFLGLKLPDEHEINLHLPKNGTALNLPVEPNEIPVRAPNEIVTTGMLSVPLFSGFQTTLEKQEEKLNVRSKVFEEIDRKYNDALISSLTGIKEDEKILALKKFCNFSNEFILNTSQYDFAVAIAECYKEFEKQN